MIKQTGSGMLVFGQRTTSSWIQVPSGTCVGMSQNFPLKLRG